MSHVLGSYLREKGWISVVVSGGEDSTDTTYTENKYMNTEKYRRGVAQPAVLCVKSDGTVLYAWASDPSTVSEPCNHACQLGFPTIPPFTFAMLYPSRTQCRRTGMEPSLVLCPQISGS